MRAKAIALGAHLFAQLLLGILNGVTEHLESHI